MALTERLQTLHDTLEREKKRDHEDWCVASSTAGRAFKPKMRVTWAPGAAGASRLSEVDRVCYDRWAKRATDLLREADVPACTLVKDTVDPGKTLLGLLARSRAGTVRLRVPSWESFARWLMWRREKRCPGSAVDVVDYVSEKMSEAPAACFPRSFGAPWCGSKRGRACLKLSNDDVVAMVEAAAGNETVDKL